MLLPILGENVCDIVLRYVTIHDTSRNELKYDVLEDRLNVHEFCHKYLNNYQLQIFVTNSIFDQLKSMYESGDCGQAIIERRLCIEHYHRCRLRKEFSAANLTFCESIFPEWVTGSPSLQKELYLRISVLKLDEQLYDAFLADIKKKYPNSPEESIKGLDEEDKYKDLNRSFC